MTVRYLMEEKFINLAKKNMKHFMHMFPIEDEQYRSSFSYAFNSFNNVFFNNRYATIAVKISDAACA